MPLTATLTHRLAQPEGVSTSTQSILNDGRVLALDHGEDGVSTYRWLDPSGRGPGLLAGKDFVGAVSVVDESVERFVLVLDGDPQVFDLRSGAWLGALEGHQREIYWLRALPSGRVMTQSVDGHRRSWDITQRRLLSKQHLRWYKGWSAPVGLLPGDPMLSCLSSMRRGRWVSALVNAHTGRDVGRHSLPARQPAHHAAVPRPGALEWVGVICEGSEGAWGPSRVVHFVAGEARVIDEEPLSDSLPGVVSLDFLTEDWLFTSGCRRPHVALNLRTGQRRPCPLPGPTHPSGLMLCTREHAVLDLNSGDTAPLYPGEAPEEGRGGEALSPDGQTVLVSTPEALEWWAITR